MIRTFLLVIILFGVLIVFGQHSSLDNPCTRRYIQKYNGDLDSLFHIENVEINVDTCYLDFQFRKVPKENGRYKYYNLIYSDNRLLELTNMKPDNILLDSSFYDDSILNGRIEYKWFFFKYIYQFENGTLITFTKTNRRGTKKLTTYDYGSLNKVQELRTWPTYDSYDHLRNIHFHREIIFCNGNIYDRLSRTKLIK